MSRKPEIKSFKPCRCRCCYKWRCQCLIPRKRKPHPPFNIATKQDNKLGLHPKLCTRALTSPAVGSYYPRSIDRIPGVVSWKRQKETEEFSAMIGCKLLKAVVQKDLMKSGRGPGSHEILRWPESTLAARCKSVQRDIDFGTVPRFQSSYKSITPGPGYTFRTHNPYYYLDQKRLKGFSCVPSFEFDGFAPRFRETKRSWSLACNRYNVKYPNSLETFLKKVTGKRGPYDLFTGPRDETTVKGYWTHTKLEDYNDWSQKLPDKTEKFWNKCNYFKGKWSNNPRFVKRPVTRMMLQDISLCYKEPDEPGPDHYNPRMPRKPSTLKKYPFDSNIKYARPLPSREIRPDPRRYKIKESYSIKGHGWTCVFKSVASRTIGVTIPSYSDF